MLNDSISQETVITNYNQITSENNMTKKFYDFNITSPSSQIQNNNTLSLATSPSSSSNKISENPCLINAQRVRAKTKQHYNNFRSNTNSPPKNENIRKNAFGLPPISPCYSQSPVNFQQIYELTNNVKPKCVKNNLLLCENDVMTKNCKQFLNSNVFQTICASESNLHQNEYNYLTRNTVCFLISKIKKKIVNKVKIQ